MEILYVLILEFQQVYQTELETLELQIDFSTFSSINDTDSTSLSTEEIRKAGEFVRNPSIETPIKKGLVSRLKI